jgi:hypothetical protein
MATAAQASTKDCRCGTRSGRLLGPGVEGVKPNLDGSNLRVTENPAPTAPTARIKANIEAIKIVNKLTAEPEQIAATLMEMVKHRICALARSVFGRRFVRTGSLQEYLAP